MIPGTRCHRCGMSFLAHEVALGDSCEGWLRQKALGGMLALSRIMFWACLEFEYLDRLHVAQTKDLGWNPPMRKWAPRREDVFLDHLAYQRDKIYLSWR